MLREDAAYAKALFEYRSDGIKRRKKSESELASGLPDLSPTQRFPDYNSKISGLTPADRNDRNPTLSRLQGRKFPGRVVEDTNDPNTYDLYWDIIDVKY